LESLIHTGKVAAHKRLHAEILLKADISELGDKWLDRQISEAFGVSTRTVERVRERLVQEGLEPALNRAKPIRVKSRTEMDTILDSVPRKVYISPHKDYITRMTGLQNLAKLYGIQFWKTRTLMLTAFNIYSDDRTCSIAKQFITKLACMDSALIDVCRQLKIDAELIKTMADCKGETETGFNDYVEAELVEQYTELFTKSVM